MEMTDLFSSLPLTIAVVGFMIALLITGIMIVVFDTKKMRVKMWQLLLFVAVGFIGVFVTRLITGTFSPIWLICIPIYVVLNILNTMFNHNKFIGQADIDVFSGTVALAVPTLILIGMQDFGDENTAIVNNIHMLNYGSELLLFFLIGIISSIAVFLVKLAINNKTWRKFVAAIIIANVIGVGVSIYIQNEFIGVAVLLVSLIGTYIYSKMKTANTFDTVKNMYYPSGIKKEENDIKDSQNTKTKMPVCVAFMPTFAYAVYFAMLVVFVN